MSDTTDLPLPALRADLVKCMAGLHGEDHEFWKRMYVRTWFALVDATCFWLRRVAFFELNRKGKEPSEIWKLALLAPARKRIKDTGGLRDAEQKETYAPYVAFSIRCACEILGVGGERFGGKGWKAFNDAVRVRDRITHPKDDGDVGVEDGEVETLDVARAWFDEIEAEVTQRLVEVFVERHGGVEGVKRFIAKAEQEEREGAEEGGEGE